MKNAKNIKSKLALLSSFSVATFSPLTVSAQKMADALCATAKNQVADLTKEQVLAAFVAVATKIELRGTELGYEEAREIMKAHAANRENLAAHVALAARNIRDGETELQSNGRRTEVA